MNANELADAMEIRASIRRQATSRKSVQENANDRLADQLDEAATMLRQQQAEIEALKADNKKAYAYIARLANEMEKAQEK
jgi:SAM-dependent MidA family methyltransferase